VWPSISKKAPFGSALLVHQLVEFGFRFIGKRCFAELELALVFTEHHRVDKPLRGLVQLVGLRTNRVRLRARGARFGVSGTRGLARLICRALRRTRFPIHVADRAFIATRPLLRGFDRLAERIDFVVDALDSVSHEPLCRAGRRSRDDENRDCNGG